MSARRKGSGKAIEEQFTIWSAQAHAEAADQFPTASRIEVTRYANDVIVTVWLPDESSARLFRFRPDAEAEEPESLAPPESETEDEITVESEDLVEV